jgi:hypothetical protein
MTFEAPGAVYTLWIIGLVVAAAVLPVVVALLHRLWLAAHHIEGYAAETLTAGLGIAGNTQHTSALRQTIETATGILGTAGAIDQHTAAIEQLLVSRTR